MLVLPGDETGHYKNLIIDSASLKKLVIWGYRHPGYDSEYHDDELRIFAPNVLLLEIKECLGIKKIQLTNVSSLVDAKLDYNQQDSPDVESLLINLDSENLESECYEAICSVHYRLRIQASVCTHDLLMIYVTIKDVLDFDFEKFCSVSLSNFNVYACLVCGKYYQGRGQKSHAYTHSLEVGHHVYISLQTEKVYCLPDGYEINDPSLDDIRLVLNPRFSRKQVEQLDKNKQWSRALDGSDYLPGMVGLNNIKDTDFVNVTIQSLMRVTPLRDFFLIPENYKHSKSLLVHRFGELTRRIWHPRNFKGQVSPHEFLRAVMQASEKRFQIGVQSDPVKFMSWLLDTLHKDLRTSKRSSSIINQWFQGELEVVEEIHGGAEGNNVVTETSRMPFLMLGLDLPPPPLFKDVMEKNIIPQVPLFNLLKKFDGEFVTEVVRPCIARMRYRVTRLPQYLILHMHRFMENNSFKEKNPTLVNFPVKNLELKDYILLSTPKEEKSQYDLIANVVHDGGVHDGGEGSYRVSVHRKSEQQWYEMQDLHVSETLPQMVALSEAYTQIYEQQR
ncbi:hypothetical protein LguiA_015038 [Lonicera macranthoides]